MTFKVGQRVELIKPDGTWSDSTFVPTGSYGVVVPGGTPGYHGPCTAVDWGSFGVHEAYNQCLRRSPDAPESTTWEAVREATGWHPQTVRAGA